MAYVDNGEDELDYEDEDYPESGRAYTHPTGAIAALAEDELEEDDYEDLYQDVDVGFFQSSEGGPQPPARFQNSGQNGAEGYGEEDYAEDYERVGRGRPVEEGRYPEEQAYRERTQAGIAQAARNGKVKIEGDHEPQDHAQGSREGALLEPKEEEVGDAGENQAGVDQMEKDDSMNVGRPKQASMEMSRAGDYGARAGAVAAPAKEERDQAESDTTMGLGRTGLNPTKVKEEGDFSGGSQLRTDLQLGRPGAGRGSKGPGTGAGGGAGGWVNGGASNESGGMSRGGGAPPSRGGLEGGVTGMWPASGGRGAGASTTAAGGTPAAALPAPISNVALPNREAAGSASDYVAKHGAAHQHETGNIMLFVGELHWWTTDAELEAALSEYGRVKNLKFFEEKASGKSKGYCQVEFYEAGAARLCKEKMDGRVFNDRPCVVAFASPQTIKQMGAAQVGKNQNQAQGQSGGQGRGRGDSGSGGRGGAAGGQMGEGGRGYGREKLPIGGRGQGPGERGRGSGRGRGGNMTGRGGGGIGGGGGGVAPFGQGPPGPMGGGPGGMMPPQGMMGGGFDPAFGPPMGGRGGYGMGPGGPGAGFGPRAHPFGGGPGMGPPFPAMGPGLPGVAPHVNPAFFGRANGNGPGIGMDGPAGGWGEGPMPGWVGEEHERRMVYGEDMGGPDYGYPGEMGPERLRPGPTREQRERGADGEWVGAERRRREDRGEGEWDRERGHRERGEREGYWERDQGREKDKDWQERERAPRARDKPRTGVEEEERPRSRDEDFGKRRRMVADRKIER